MKAIIPVAGVGSRLRPHTHTQPKALVPVAGKPILAHIVDHLTEIGLKEFVFIVGYLGDKIEDFIKKRYSDLSVEFVVQEPREGIGHAVFLAKNKIKKNEEILIVLGDTIFDADLKNVLSSDYSSLGTKKVTDPRNFGVAEIDEKGTIIHLVEKPVIPKSNLALVGIYYIKQSDLLMKTLSEIISGTIKINKEVNLTDALMHMVKKGIEFKTFPVDNWFDCGSKLTLLETNAILLKRNFTSEEEINFPNTIVIHPVKIAENCTISNSIIGPNVSVGENTIINYSIIKGSIIGAFAQLENAVIHESIIGSDSSLRGLSQSLNIGDSTEIDFS